MSEAGEAISVSPLPYCQVCMYVGKKNGKGNERRGRAVCPKFGHSLVKLKSWFLTGDFFANKGNGLLVLK